MALMRCRECKGTIAANAINCFHCGATNRRDQSTGRGNGSFGLVTILVIAGALALLFNLPKRDRQSPQREPEETPAQQAARMEACKRDLHCWAEENFAFAEVHCRRAVESLAQYGVKWTDGWLQFKFDGFRWAGKERRAITYIGDKVLFQNGFGAMQNMIYQCDFDPVSRRVLDVRVEPGRF